MKKDCFGKDNDHSFFNEANVVGEMLGFIVVFLLLTSSN